LEDRRGVDESFWLAYVVRILSLLSYAGEVLGRPQDAKPRRRANEQNAREQQQSANSADTHGYALSM
jgi:hypothetical protein